MSENRFGDYEEYCRSEIAALRYVLSVLLARSDVVPSQFALQQVIPVEAVRATCTLKDPGRKYYLVHLDSVQTGVGRKAFLLRLAVVSESSGTTVVKVDGCTPCNLSEVLTFDLHKIEFTLVR